MENNQFLMRICGFRRAVLIIIDPLSLKISLIFGQIGSVKFLTLKLLFGVHEHVGEAGCGLLVRDSASETDAASVMSLQDRN